LPAQERFDLVSQVRRASKAGPAILAEGWPKRYYRKVWRKYLLDVQGECSEMIHHLNVCSDIYPGSVPVDLINRLLKLYSISAKQISVLIKNC